MAVVGLVLPGWPGHDNPARRLGRVLTEAGHEVVAWTAADFGYEIPASGPHTAMQPDAEMIRAAAHYVAARLAGVAVELTGPTIEALNEHEVDLVVHDSMASWGRMAADWLGLPRISSLTHYPPPLLAPLTQPPAELEAMLIGSRNELIERWGVDIGGPFEVVFNLGHVTFLYTIERVLGIPPMGQTWRLVGPLLEPPPAPPVAAEPPLVYVSMGTSFNRRAEVHRTVLEALADLDVRVLVSTGRGLAPDELGPLPANASAIAWADTRAVLAEASVLVTHGGATTIHEALAAAVPMLILPQAVDQPRWGERMEALGIGELPGEHDAGAIGAAVERLLADEDVQARAQALSVELQGYDGEAIALEAVESLMT